MNKNQNKSQMLYHVVTPFPGFEGTEFFDDCPICQDLKAEIALGNLEGVSNQEVPDNSVVVGHREWRRAMKKFYKDY